MKKPPIETRELPDNPAETDVETSVVLKASGERRPFPIVGIGASAGGLEALETFLKNVTVGSGMGYVIIQHLDPTHKDILVELLQRATLMPVVQVADRLKIKPDTVYVIPPNKDMSILHGVLHLFAPVAPRGLRLPIDFFFRSLADDQQERSVGVILSGMGSDGTLGLRAIKEKAGAVFVQDPASAKFDGMPSSAIDAGYADVVAAAEDLPGKIIAYLQHIPQLIGIDQPLENKNQSGLEKVLILLRAQTGHDFSLYKKSTIYRRIERRMGLHQIERITNYVRFLQENPHETDLLFKELLIGVTSFFRDPAAWEALGTKIIPELLAAHPLGGVLRAWTAGCSTGEEAYSLAIIFKEALAQVNPEAACSLQIFATDLDRESIDIARQGFYPANIAADVTPERLKSYFVQEENGYRVSKDIRGMVIFAPQNLVMDAPFTKLDILICRNVLIYFESELQKKVLPLFHYSLNPGGVLFLGSAETPGSSNHLFITLDNKLRLYRRLEGALTYEPVDFPISYFSSSERGKPMQSLQPKELQPIPNLAVLVDKLVLTRFAPAAVLINLQGDILYISGRTGKYLEPAAGKANLNIFAMAREGLRYELSTAVQKAAREQNVVTYKNLAVGTNGGTQMIDLTVQPLTEPDGLQGMLLIVFTETAVPLLQAKTSGKSHNTTENDAIRKQLEQDLARAQDELQITREEMQTSQEELKSTNEEMQSANEELQSMNEELTTSREEMQSLNEELTTVNHELQARVNDLQRSNNDMKNLLDSTNIATLFLDANLHVRRFTSQAARIFRLIPSDAGRQITDIASDLIYPELDKDVLEVLDSLVYKERTVATRDGGWFMVRIMPYRTLDNRIDGAVITFANISVAKALEADLRGSEQDSKALVQSLPYAFGLFESVFDQAGHFIDGRFVDINAAFERVLQVKLKEVRGRRMSEIWPESEKSWIDVFGSVATSGVSSRFSFHAADTGKTFPCRVFRPGNSQVNFCVILEEINPAEGES